MSQETPNIDDVLRIRSASLEPLGWHSVIRDLLKICEAEKAVMLTAGLTAAIKTASQNPLYLGAVKKGRHRPEMVSIEHFPKPHDTERQLNVFLTNAMPEFGETIDHIESSTMTERQHRRHLSSTGTKRGDEP